MSVKRALVLFALISTAAACAGRQIYAVYGCEERLGSPYKRAECRACIERPVPHVFLPDNADGDRCYRR